MDFYRTWASYKEGFGSLAGEHWMGNDKLHRLTSQRAYELRIDLTDWEGNTRYAVYDSFSVADESDYYRLSVGSYSGSAGKFGFPLSCDPFRTPRLIRSWAWNVCLLL